MADRLPDELLLRIVDAFFDAGKDLARALIAKSVETRSDQAGAVEARAIGTDTTGPAPSSNWEPLMTVEDLADYLKIKPQTLRDWAKKGHIPYEPLRSEIRFRRSVIDKWMAENRAAKFPPAQNGVVVKSDRSFLRPQNHRSKSNGRV
jgi:excisionase family DNA binding protein